MVSLDFVTASDIVSHDNCNRLNTGIEMGATIYDIARLTGYNPGTVSRALNNDPRVKDKTREKICEVG